MSAVTDPVVPALGGVSIAAPHNLGMRQDREAHSGILTPDAASYARFLVFTLILQAPSAAHKHDSNLRTPAEKLTWTEA
jgi:hypothetical protein